MSAANQAELEIRAIVEGWAKAVRVRDSEALTSSFAPEVLVFDLIEPLQYSGRDAIAQRAAQWLSSFIDPLDYEVRDLKITASADAAFCHSLNHVSGTRTDGQKIEMWWRATVCFARREGKWLVTHEHSSVPFDMQTGTASLTLKP